MHRGLCFQHPSATNGYEWYPPAHAEGPDNEEQNDDDRVSENEEGSDENEVGEVSDVVNPIVRPGYLTAPDKKGQCEYVNTSLNMTVQVLQMHWDVSAGYTKDVCHWFFWHVGNTADSRRRGIPFIVARRYTLRTLDAFAKLFYFNPDGEGMKFYSCPIGGDACPQFSCYAHLLFHMEASEMVGCQEAEKMSITHGYPWNAMPGYLIDKEVLEVLERTHPTENRRHDLIIGNKPPCRFEQRACLSFRRGWHHDKNLSFYSYLHTNSYVTNHKEGNNEYMAFAKKSKKGLELFADHRGMVDRRAHPLRKEHPHIYKMPFILDYKKWPRLAQLDFNADTQTELRRSERHR